MRVSALWLRARLLISQCQRVPPRRLFLNSRRSASRKVQEATDIASGTAAVPATSTSRQGDASLKQIYQVPARLHAHLFGGAPSPASPTAEDVDFETLELPVLKGDNLLSHFDNVSSAQIADYRSQLEKASRLDKLPELPGEWSFALGWTKYGPEPGAITQVEYPDEEILFFDVEVCVSDGQLPTLATAVSPNAWYSWCSGRLVNNDLLPLLYRPGHLIQLEAVDPVARNAKIIIGHNVGYDRSRVAEQYLRKCGKARFWDTMSMAIPIYGMADHQVPLFEKSDIEEDDAGTGNWVDDWRSRVSRNSLAALHEKLCSGKSSVKLDKSMQDFFVKESIQEIRNNFQDLMQYCAVDVLACCDVYRALYPEFVKRFPHPVTWHGMLEMGNAYLPVTKNWRLFFEACEAKTARIQEAAARGVMRAAAALNQRLRDSEKFKEDPWMWVENWNGKTSPAWYASLLQQKRLLDVPIEELSPNDVKLKSRTIARLFGLCWGPYPLHFKRDKGWGFLAPKEDISTDRDLLGSSIEKLRRGEEVSMPTRAILEVIDGNLSAGVGDIPLGSPVASVGCFNFHRLPHPKGLDANVGDPLSKDFYTQLEEGVLRPSRFVDEFQLLLAKKQIRFWINYRDRFEEQVTVWLDDEGNEGAIAPAVIPAGTVTRRAVHKLWLTASNPKDIEMIGTDLKSMVECPPEWYLVGGDVDSQEQWIAAMLGDSAIGLGVAGATPFSNMLLAGSKADHSDLHSVVAKEVGISRDKAKVLNYARLYGSGIRHAVEFLKQSGVEKRKAEEISEKLFATTKGRVVSCYRLNKDMHEHFEYFLEEVCPKWLKSNYIVVNTRYFLPERNSSRGRLAKYFLNWMERRVREELNLSENDHFNNEVFFSQLFDTDYGLRRLYYGGFESETFNYLELVVGEAEPRTPVLDCQLGYALSPLSETVPNREAFLAKYRRSIVNWVVQSSAVDFLHLLLTCMRWLCEEFDIDARFVISIHDEIRYLVSAEDRYRCALALALSNMYVRAMISQKLRINQLPMSVAFFSQVDVDHVLRKEVNMLCRTPDGKEIPPGEALDIKAILKKTGGSLRRGKKVDIQSP